MFTRSDEEGVRSLLRLKRDLAALRRVLYPLRAIFQVLLRRDHPFFPGSTEVYLRDVYDHLLRILDELDAERDMARPPRWRRRWRSAAHRLNKTMKTLAVITVAVAVVGSVFGAYGMNFEVDAPRLGAVGLLARRRWARSPWSRRPSWSGGGGDGGERSRCRARRRREPIGSASRHEPVPIPGRRPMQVLIADDDSVSRRLLQSYLQKWGYEVTAAQDGAEAWRPLRERAASPWSSPTG